MFTAWLLNGRGSHQPVDVLVDGVRHPQPDSSQPYVGASQYAGGAAPTFTLAQRQQIKKTALVRPGD